jgi:serpin B
MATRCIGIILALALFSCKQANKVSSRDNNVEQYEFAKGVGMFTFDLMEVAHANGENLFYSPLSVYVALGQAYAGASGQTARQMARSMHFGSPFAVARGYNTTTELLAIQDSFTKLGLANAIWLQEGFSILPGFSGILDTLYRSPARYAYFSSLDGREDARHEMNEWVKEITWGKIPELISGNVLNELTRLVLINALAFKSKWASGFDAANTRQDVFNLSNGGESQCDYMSKTGRLRIYRGEQHTFVELPFTSEDFAMVLSLPNSFEKKAKSHLSFDALLESISKMETLHARILIPVLQLESRKELVPYLQELGMIDAFTTTADFSGISGNKDLKIDQVLHQAVLDMNEHGVEAAAATAVVMGVKSAFIDDPVEIHFNKPYSLFIIHKPTRLLLFAGKIEDPSKK